MIVRMIIIDCRSTIEIWMGGVLSRRLIFHFPRTLEYRGKAPSQIRQNINPTNTYTRTECQFSKSTAPSHGPSKALSKPSPMKSKQNETFTSHASSPALFAYWTERFMNFLTHHHSALLSQRSHERQRINKVGKDWGQLAFSFAITLSS